MAVDTWKEMFEEELRRGCDVMCVRRTTNEAVEDWREMHRFLTDRGMKHTASRWKLCSVIKVDDASITFTSERHAMAVCTSNACASFKEVAK